MRIGGAFMGGHWDANAAQEQKMEGDQTIGENNNPVVPKPDQPSHTYEMKKQQQNMTLDPTIEYETDLL